MKVLQEFKEFAVRGNVIDLAVGIIIGASFGKIVTSLVNDILMPPVSLLTGNLNFADRFVVLRGSVPGNQTVEAAKAAGATTLNWGLFVNVVIEFLIVAFAVFLLVRQVNRLRRRTAPAPPPPAATKPCPHCTMAIPVKAKRCPQCTSAL